MSAYKLYHDSVSIIRKSDGALIPFDAGNKDYLEYLDWTKTGQTAEAADPNPFLAPQEIKQPTLTELQAQLSAIKEQIDAIS